MPDAKPKPRRAVATGGRKTGEASAKAGGGAKRAGRDAEQAAANKAAGKKAAGKKAAGKKAVGKKGASRKAGADRDGGPPDTDAALMTAAQVAERAGVTVGTLKRWVKAGAIPGFTGDWTSSAAAHARIVSQLRRAGQPLDEIARAARDGRLALGAADSLFAPETHTYTLEEACKKAGISTDLAERLWIALGFSTESINEVTEQDVEALGRVSEVLAAGLPLGALLQVIRVASKSFSDIADAEARLIRMFVHEPLLQQGASGKEIQSTMGTLIEGVLPHMAPMFEYMHSRFLQQYAEQIQIENVQGDMSTARGRLNVAICFVDIAGFTRYTEEAGVEKAFEQADRLRHHIETTLPDTARMIKLTGDGAMIVGSEATELARWAVHLAEEKDEVFRLRIGLDYGEALYRDGDYFGGAINMAARVLKRADVDEALATDQFKRQITDRAVAGLRFQSIGPVRLKGFDDPVELFRVQSR